MKALLFVGPKRVALEEVPDPRIVDARDAIVRVTSATICGTDMHMYNGYLPQKTPIVPGHEFCGEVVETGAAVRGLRAGDRVVAAALIACGECWFCARGQTPHCERTNPDHYGPDGEKDHGAAVFGLGDAYGHYDGGQAQYVRVPYAEFNCRRIPVHVSDEKALFLSDIIPTGWCAAAWADPSPGDVVAVLGCGPVGLMALKSAALLGAGRLIAVDPVHYRRELARRLTGAETLDPDNMDAVREIRAVTGGRGADRVIDAVGMEARHGWTDSMANLLHGQTGVTKAADTAVQAVRRGGTISVIGVYANQKSHNPLGALFEKGVTLRTGPAIMHPILDRLMDMVARGWLTADDLVSHHLPLAEGDRAYQLFNDKSDECMKVVLRPWPRRSSAAQRLREAATAGA